MHLKREATPDSMKSSPNKNIIGGGTKRQRTSDIMLSATVNDLSADLWCGIADFLPKTSRALLAVALRTLGDGEGKPSNGQHQSAVGRAIISRTNVGLSFAPLLDELCEEARGEVRGGKHRVMKRSWERRDKDHDSYFRELLSDQLEEYYDNEGWETLDFVDIPASVASKLTDDDIRDVLLCIDAKNKLKRLTLTNCTSVVGHFLEPLRCSTVLEKLDLGLIRQFETSYWREASERWRKEFVVDNVNLREGPVCDIIDSILRGGGGSFKRLQFPHKWYAKNNPDYVEMSSTLPYHSFNQWPLFLRSERMRQFVNDHNAVLNYFNCCLYYGIEDKSAFCSSLEQLESGVDFGDYCGGCNVWTCYRACTHCDEIICTGCCDDTHECNVCNKYYCPRCCKESGFEDEVEWCDAVGWGGDCEAFCSDCRLSSCRNGNNDCYGCKGMAFDKLLEEFITKQTVVEDQRGEIERCQGLNTNTNTKVTEANTPNLPSNIGGEEAQSSDSDSCSYFCCRDCGRDRGCGNCAHCDEFNGVSYCDAYCPDCRLSRCREGKTSCTECKSMAFDTLLEESNVIQAQIDSQREEIGRLRQG